MSPRHPGVAIVDTRPPLGALPPAFVLKPRSSGDSEALWHLFNQEGFQRFGTILAPFESPADVDAWSDANGSGNFEVVGMIDGAVVAFAGLYPLHGRQSHIGSISVCVHDAFHGRGIGTALLRLILASADVLAGLRRIQLYVFADNQRAIALYRAAGFCIEGRHESFARRGEAYVDAFTMARMIPEPSAAQTDADIIALFARMLPSNGGVVLPM